MRNFIEKIAAIFMGVAAFLIYAPYMEIAFSYTYEYSTLIYESLKHIPCDQDPCNLQLFVSLFILVARDTLFALPILFVFGFLLGLILKHYRFSRPVFLCAAFFLTRYWYNAINEVVSEFPQFVEWARAVPIILLFILFTKSGYSMKLKLRFRKIARGIKSEAEKEEKERNR